jgi:hypothetical protein
VNLKDLLRKRKGKHVVKAPDIKLGKYWSFESGSYWDTINRKPTKDFYFGIKFRIDW